MNKNNANIEKACAFVYDGQVIQPRHMEALLNLDRITDLDILQELADDCLTIASEENLEGLINPSFFKHMRWIINYLRDLKKVPIKPCPNGLPVDGVGHIIKPRTIKELQQELAELKAKEAANGQA